MILDLFAGPGGWSEGLRMLGLSDVGLEKDAAACATRAAAGHLTVRCDLTDYPALAFGKVEGLIASPPCQDFSLAGNRAGRTGDKGELIDLVPPWVAATSPRWIACEQVPPALPIWREHADVYRRMGYSVWTGILNAADYGVPQTRERAVLVASLDVAACPPEATHAAAPEASLFGHTPLPWVSLQEALGFELEMTYKRGAGMLERYGERPGRSACEPSFTITGAALGGGGGPKMVVRTGGNERPLTTAEALTLQSFRQDYPVQGGKSKQGEQIGNAVPPLLAAHVVWAIRPPSQDSTGDLLIKAARVGVARVGLADRLSGEPQKTELVVVDGDGVGGHSSQHDKPAQTVKAGAA